MNERQLVYLVRHGQTAWTTAMRHTGRTDIPLTDAGRNEAAVLRPVFQDIDLDLVLSSPLQRAFETCRIAGLADRARTSVDLMEWDYGDYEGKTTEEIGNHHVPVVRFSTAPSGRAQTPSVRSAMRTTASSIKIKQPDAGAVFAHGHLLRVLGARRIGL